MSRKADVEALLGRADKSLPRIISMYKDSLNKKGIDSDLSIDIKEYFSHLKSVLDYLAHDIVDKYCHNADPKDRLYFPIRDNHRAFEDIMKKSYPDLQTNSKKVYDYLESIQSYQKNENEWLKHFNKLNNENKHDRLVPQTRTETERVNVKTESGAEVDWKPKNVKYGLGVSIGGVPVNPQTQLPNPSTTQTVTIWSEPLRLHILN